MGYNELTIYACSDKRFTKNHFILSNVNKKFLQKHKIEKITVKNFRDFVKQQKPEFKALAGSFLTNLKRVNVYNIETIKKQLKEKNEKQNRII